MDNDKNDSSQRFSIGTGNATKTLKSENQSLMKNIFNISKIVLIVYLLLSVTSCNSEKRTESKSKNHETMKTDNSNNIILINPFEVPKGKLEETIKYWEDCRDFLKKQPGYVSTKLHKSIKDDAKFELINIAVWENPKVFSEATQKMMKELGVPPVEELKPNPSLYTIVRE